MNCFQSARKVSGGPPHRYLRAVQTESRTGYRHKYTRLPMPFAFLARVSVMFFFPCEVPVMGCVQACDTVCILGVIRVLRSNRESLFN